MNEEFSHDGFISYSWSDPSIQARVKAIVKAALAKHGLKLWQDVDEIGQGRMFEQMGLGIKLSEFFIPMITEEYVRKVDGERLGMEDRVSENCLFEVNYAMLHRGELGSIPIIMEDKMRKQQEWGKVLGGNLGQNYFISCVNEQEIDNCVDELARVMQNARKSRKNKPFARKTGILSLVDLEAVQFVPKLKAQEYVDGTRLWIYQVIQKDWLDVAKWTQVFVLLGHAGVGKSVCMANICDRGHLFEPGNVYQILATKNDKTRSTKTSLPRALVNRVSKRFSQSLKDNFDFIVVACHFFKHDDSELRSGKTCLLSVAAQLCETVPEFFHFCDFNSLQIGAVDITELFRRLITTPLRKMDERGLSPGKRAFVVLDALDECDPYDRKQLMHVLQMDWLELIPKWLGVCVSSRPEDYIPPKLKEYNPSLLNTEDQRNMKDMQVYLRYKLGTFFQDQQELELAVQIVLERSQGHFLYARFIEAELSKKTELTLNDVQCVDIFPASLNGYYETYFRRLLDSVGEKVYGSLLSSMCVAREPLPIDALGKILDISNKKVKLLLKKMAQLLVITNQSVRFVHKSMADFLLDVDQCSDEELLVDEEAGAKAMARYCKQHCLDDPFAAKHFVHHLTSNNADTDNDPGFVANILCNFPKLHQILVDLKVSPRAFVRDLNHLFYDHQAWNIDPAAILVVRALAKSLHGLDHDPRELAGQLLGRIGDRNHPVLKTMESLGYTWLRPLHSCLTEAENPLRMILNGHSYSVESVAMNREIIASGSKDHTIKIWSRSTGECLKTLSGHSGLVKSVAVGDHDLMVSGSFDCTVKIWSLHSGECVRTLKGHSDKVSCVALDEKNNSILLSGSYDKTIKVWSLETGRCIKTLNGHLHSVYCVAVHDGIVVSGSDIGTVNVWELSTGFCLQRILLAHERAVTCIAIDDGIFVSGSWDQTVKVWDIQTFECFKTLHGHSSVVYSVTIKNGIVVSGSQDQSVNIWNLKQDYKLVATFRGHANYVYGVAMESKTIATASGDNTVRVWAYEKDRSYQDDTSDAHSDTVRSATIGGDIIVTGSEDHTVKVWSLSTGQCLHTFEDHSSYVFSVTIVGDTIISKSQDEVICWSRTTFERVNNDNIPNLQDANPNDTDIGPWIIKDTKISHPLVDVGFTLDASVWTCTSTETHIACFDLNHKLNLLTKN